MGTGFYRKDEEKKGKKRKRNDNLWLKMSFKCMGVPYIPYIHAVNQYLLEILFKRS